MRTLVQELTTFTRVLLNSMLEKMENNKGVRNNGTSRIFYYIYVLAVNGKQRIYWEWLNLAEWMAYNSDTSTLRH